MRNKYQKEQSEIYKFRLKDSEFKEIKGNHILFYKHEPIGIYTKNNSPPDLNQLQQKNINWKKVDLEIKKQKDMQLLRSLPQSSQEEE